MRAQFSVVFAAILAMMVPLSAVSPAQAAVTAPSGFTSMVPSRLLDTRIGVGASKVAVAAHGTVHLQVTGRGGVPASGVSAVVVNVTVTQPTSAGFVTVYGDGKALPTASNVNFVKSQTVPNLVIAPVSANGKVALFNGSAGTVQLIGDVSGYYLAGAPTVAGAFGALAPSRLLDTRIGLGGPKGAVWREWTVPVRVRGRGGIPATGVSAVVLNVTVTQPTTAGFLTVYGDGYRPEASNLNFLAGQTVPNLVIAPVAADGTISLFNGSTGGVQMIADVSGYFLAGAPMDAGAFGSLAPSRLLDTRIGVGAPKVAVAAGGTVHLRVAGVGLVPASVVSAVVLNVTVTQPTSAGFVTVHRGGTVRPTTSNLNFRKSQTVPNLVIAPVGVDGMVDLYNGSDGTIQLVADVAGWFLNTTASPGAAAYSWGGNYSGELGDGTTTNRMTPGAVGTDTHWASISAGQNHTAGVKTDGTLWSWGGNVYGELGDGTTTNRLVPVQVGTERHWASVAAGFSRTFGLKTDGTLWAWGANHAGLLGDGTTTDQWTPVQVGTDTGWASVRTGDFHTMAIRTDGTLWAWGANYKGALGDGTRIDRTAPVQVGAGTGWASVAVGVNDTLGVKTDGTLWAWGENSYGQLGDGTLIDRTAPVQVGTDTAWGSVAAGQNHTMGVKQDGTLWAWGYNSRGELGDGTTTNRTAPVQVGTDTGWASVAAGATYGGLEAGFTLAIKTEGTLWGWGRNLDGILGDGTISNRTAPVQIGTGSGWARVAAGSLFAVALRS
jgi:alpha-tubulin suppressor-like RCC1 family protein